MRKTVLDLTFKNFEELVYWYYTTNLEKIVKVNVDMESLDDVLILKRGKANINFTDDFFKEFREKIILTHKGFDYEITWDQDDDYFLPSIEMS